MTYLGTVDLPKQQATALQSNLKLAQSLFQQKKPQEEWDRSKSSLRCRTQSVTSAALERKTNLLGFLHRRGRLMVAKRWVVSRLLPGKGDYSDVRRHF